MAHSPFFCLPLQVSLCLPFLLTWNPPSCDRIRPPWSQVACKLTPPLSQPFTRTLPLQIPRTPTAQRLTTTTSGIIRRLLSGTVCTKTTLTGKSQFQKCGCIRGTRSTSFYKDLFLTIINCYNQDFVKSAYFQRKVLVS
jgi:hypothetical protein